MKEIIRQMLAGAAQDAHKAGELASDAFPPITIEEPKIDAHGDLSTNFAMVNAAVQKMAPRKIAETIIRNLKDPDNLVLKTEIAGPGFINFFIKPSAWLPIISEIHQKDGTFGATDIGRGRKIMVEFVSANPTGPLHVGHGRGAVVGDTIASVLSFCGYDVRREYYINDSGRQIQTLGASVFLRCRELAGEAVTFPDDHYKGEYIYDIAKAIVAEKGEWLFSITEQEAVITCAAYAAKVILDGIAEDLERLGIRFDKWFSEQTLYDSGKVESVIRDFRDRDLIYEKDGALWFRSEAYGDEKDRVVVRQNGQTTYFASDIAYHHEKFDRGFERIIDVWGADHHGYVPRLTAAIKALGRDADGFNVILTQLVNLLRQGAPVAMSTRAGEFVTLKEVVDEVGSDAARFIFLTRHHESPLDFDLEVAKQKTNDNPVYYVQYVHARISSILKKAREENGIETIGESPESLGRLVEPEEISLIKQMGRYPETVRTAAEMMEPHRIAYFLMDLAASFHAYYNKHRVLTDDPKLTGGRLYLVLAVLKVIKNGLHLLGVSAPETM